MILFYAVGSGALCQEELRALPHGVLGACGGVPNSLAALVDLMIIAPL